MSNFQSGDLITFPLRGEKFGLAKILHIEELSQYHYYHIAIRDALLDAGPGGLDEQGEPYERTHELDGAEAAPVVVDHLAVTLDAFLASDPLYVGEEPVGPDELHGYQVYLHLMREDAIRRGAIRADEFTDDEEEEGYSGDEEGEDSDDEGSDSDKPAEESEAGDDAEMPLRIEAHTWHMQTFDRPIADVLFELHQVFAGEKFRDTKLGAYITSYFDGSNSEEIDALVESFIGGDYGAGQELLVYGDAAADALSHHLTPMMAPELADDILQIMCDTGSNKAYGYVADFFNEHGSSNADLLALPAARAFCYAVTLTGGTPEPLRRNLGMLDHLDDPELATDVKMAREAIQNLPVQDPALSERGSTDPFGSLG